MVVVQGYKQSGLRPGDNQTHLKAAGEKLCTSTWGYGDTRNQQETFTEMGHCPSAPLKNEERDRGGTCHQKNSLTIPAE